MKLFVLLVLSTALALPAVFASAAIPETKAVDGGAKFIMANFAADGGFSGASPGANMDAIYALRAAGFDPAKDVTAEGKSPVTYLEATAPSLTMPADAAKAALAATALGINPASVSGTNLVAAISAGFDAAKGTYAADDFSQSIAMLGLACTGNSVPASAVAELKSTQLADGGWGFGGSADPDTTAIATQALLASGVTATDTAVTKAIAWFKANQLPDGGWGFAPASNVNSTAYVVQSLIAAGQSLDIPQYIQQGASPDTYLLSQQNADGSFNGYDTLIATVQAVPALAGRTYCNAATTPITQTAPGGPLPTVPTQTPTPTPTSTATATPTSSPPPPPTVTPVPAIPTVAPRPPATGSGTGPASRPPAVLLVAAALFAVALAGAAVAKKS